MTQTDTEKLAITYLTQFNAKLNEPGMSTLIFQDMINRFNDDIYSFLQFVPNADTVYAAQVYYGTDANWKKIETKVSKIIDDIIPKKVEMMTLEQKDACCMFLF